MDRVESVLCAVATPVTARDRADSVSGVWGEMGDGERAALNSELWLLLVSVEDVLLNAVGSSIGDESDVISSESPVVRKRKRKRKEKEKEKKRKRKQQEKKRKEKLTMHLM